MSEIGMDQETVYGTHEDNHVMSEKVRTLASSIYQEFERMIARYDEDVVKDLMPLLVNVLECLDISYTENQEREVELELLREDNEQLVTQYEREKQLRKTSDQKLLELEDVAEAERKALLSKIDSLESIVRKLELKTKNSQDHVLRLEEKESELKREYSRLHDRYTELFKTHVDSMERTKLLLGSSERLESTTIGRGPSRLPSLGMAHMSRSSGPLSYGFQSLEASLNAKDIQDDSLLDAANLRSEMLDNSCETIAETFDKSQLTDQLMLENKMTGISRHESPETENAQMLISPTTPTRDKLGTTLSGRSRTDLEQRSGNTLYQELSFQDADALGEMDEGADITGNSVHPGEYASSVNDNFFGMGKEVENLILENNELLATKNALNIVKDDLIAKVDELTSEQELLREQMLSLQQTKERLKQQVITMEEELKKVKEEAEAAAKASKSDDDDNLPMNQRKRFTRLEMARVLMEKNQFKERFMDLQDAVRWSEMMRVSKNDSMSADKTKSFWKFFSSLFTTNERRDTIRGTNTLTHVQYSPPTHQIVTASYMDATRRRTLKSRQDFLDQGDISSEKLVARRANERREQYRQVRAHVRKEGGRLQAYGWSLPGKQSAPSKQPVPVPVYCRPLQETEPGMKIWCGAGVNLSGGKTRDGGSMVGGSVFYAAEAQEVNTTSKVEAEDAVEHLNKELEENEQRRIEAESLEQQLSSWVWICTSTQKSSKVTVIDANNPGYILEVFNVCQGNLLCIASIPGAKESDYVLISNEETVQATNGPAEASENNTGEAIHNDNTQTEPRLSENAEGEDQDKCGGNTQNNAENDEKLGQSESQNNTTGPQSLESIDNETTVLGKITFVRVTPDDALYIIGNNEERERSPDAEIADSSLEKMSTVQPTMWLGAQNGAVFIHSAVAKWSVCLNSIKLRDAALAIVHVQGRVLVALADGTVAIFRRGIDGQWDLSQYHIVTLGSPQFSTRCMVAVLGKTVWCGYRNKIHVIDPITMTVEHTVVAHPRKESQVRQLAWLGEGVWVSIRLDSTLRLYHAHTYQHLQDVDIEPYVSKMLGTGKLGFSFVRITALLISSCRLWIGTGNGVIISVPLSESAGGSMAVSRSQVATKGDAPGVGVRVFANDKTVTPGSFIPYCSMAHAQLSFHGHRDSVKMFVAVPGHGGQSAASDGTQPAMLVLSGGEGYIDFRVGDGEETDDGIERSNAAAIANLEEHGEQSHLIVWQVQCPPPLPMSV